MENGGQYLRSYPFRLLTAFAATFPKGTASVVAGNFAAAPKGVPLGKVAANAVSRRKGYPGKRLCLRESPQNPMKKYTQIA